ncbi:MAG: hypothetical protein AAGJ11_13270, partial [Bacteroidota bacterium]
MSPRFRSLASALFLLAALAADATAQTTPHALTVRVTDEHEGTPLPGASVVVEGLTPAVGASTDADGL